MSVATRHRLQGRTIVVTRPEDPHDTLVRGLEAEGASVVAFPVFEIIPPEDPEPLRDACANIARYHGVGATSVHGAEALLRELEKRQSPKTALRGKLVCAVGASTARVFENAGVRVDSVPQKALASELVKELAATADLTDKLFLFPVGNKARADLKEGLLALGARVDCPVAYINRPVASSAGPLGSRLVNGDIDVVTFASGSAVQGFLNRLGGELAKSAHGQYQVASIGPVTSEVAREWGLDVSIEAVEHSASGLVTAICEHFDAECSTST